MEDSNDIAAIFDLEVEDHELLTLVKDAIEESEAYWNSEKRFNLDDRTKRNVDLWLPVHHWPDEDHHDFQELNEYVEPKIFEDTESAVELVNGRLGQPESQPAQDTQTSIQLAKDVQDALYAHSKKFRTIDYFRVNTRNQVLKRRSFIKLRFDPSIGKDGDIVPEMPLPEDIVIDKDAAMFDEPRFIAQRIKNKTCQELVYEFPDQEQEIYKMFDIQRTSKKTGLIVPQYTQLRKQKNIWEIWFTYYGKKEKLEAVLWCDDKFTTVIGKMRNPNFNYEDEGFEDERAANFLDRPPKPYIRTNHLNDGSSAIDLTSLPEQAEKLQRNLDRRGYQIADNLDQMGSGIIYNVSMISKDDMEELIGAPDERIGVKGDVRSALMRVPPPILPAQVYQDKEDSRQAIDSVFGTHSITRGEKSKNPTLGQDAMQLDQDISRQSGLINANERSLTLYYRLLTQMMKVYYTEDHWFKVTGEDGQFDFVAMHSDKIEDGLEIEIVTGSALPIDKVGNKKMALELAKSGKIDPLSLYEAMSTGQLPSPKKMLERFITFSTDPMSFAKEVKDEDIDTKAMMDITILDSGQMPKPRSEITPEYLAYFNKYMISGEFQEKPDDIKKLYLEHVKTATETAQKLMQLAMTQAPTPDEMQETNQQAVEQATMEQALMQAQGGAPQPPNPSQPATGKEVAKPIA